MDSKGHLYRYLLTNIHKENFEKNLDGTFRNKLPKVVDINNFKKSILKKQPPPLSESPLPEPIKNDEKNDESEELNETQKSKYS